VLDETYRIPPLDGGARSLWDLHRSLIDLGHDAAVSSDPTMLEAQQQWDVVMVSRPMFAARLAVRARRVARSHTVYIGHDLHHRRLAAPDGALEGHPRPVAALTALERYCWKSFDRTIYPNNEEVGVARAAGAHARWFPYFRIDHLTPPSSAAGPAQAVHDNEFPHLPGEAEPAEATSTQLLFVGGSAHSPNVSGLRWFVAEVLPALPRTTVIVVGRWEASLRDPLAAAGLRFTGPLPDAELVALGSRVTANIAPLTAGAGLKSKVVEALASGVPLIATSVAMAGIDQPWRLALQGDDGTQWRAALATLNRPAVTTPLVKCAANYVHRTHGTVAYLQAVSALLTPPHHRDPVAR
jgi:O-antigen biosynthesis protein